MFIYLSLLVCIAGGLIYAFADPKYPKAQEIGRMCFWCGLLAFLLTFPGHYVAIAH